MNKSVVLLLCLIFLLAVSAKADRPVMGDEQMDLYLHKLQGKRVGLVVNHTSVLNGANVHLLDALVAKGVNVVTLFAPEHGFRGEADAGAVVKDGRDVKTGVRIASLHGSSKKPSAQLMEEVDVMVFDIQDVGTRFYTYISTMFYVMEACAENNKELIVLDRPNPNDYVDGPVLEPSQFSFVGIVTIPLLHGLTVGELARMINGERWLRSTSKSCALTVIPVKNWRHSEPYSLPIKPSPNLPDDRSVQLYPSLCLFEATVISLGRGTTFPFTVLGAPDSKYGTFTFTPRSLEGFDTNPTYKNQLCYGVDLRNDSQTKGFSLKYVIDFAAKAGGMEKLVNRRKAFDQLAGTPKLYEQLNGGMSETEIKKSWQPSLDRYKTIRKKYLIYAE